MPDKRQHRGPHPEDHARFAREAWPTLQEAVAHLSWLLSRGYATASAVKLVGDRFQLDRRQRLAVQRAACADEALLHRLARCRACAQLAGQELLIDGFNLLLTVEAALSGAVLLHCRDGCLRDMSSVHGSYRKVSETTPALNLIGQVLAAARPSRCTWWLDRPVSNSGRVATLINEVAAERQWDWGTGLAMNVDRQLVNEPGVVLSSDSVVLDQCDCWANLVPEIVYQAGVDLWIVPLDDVAQLG